MGRTCFISSKTEDFDYKEKLQKMNISMIDKSLNIAIDSKDEDYIMATIRKDYLSDSTVTIHLLGLHSAEKLGYEEQKYIKRELQASLYNGKGNTRSGILGIVVPRATDLFYKGKYNCSKCKNEHNWVVVNDSNSIKEFNYNYYLPNEKCHHTEDDRYAVMVKWDDFVGDPEGWIEKAFAKRDHEISKQIKVYP